MRFPVWGRLRGQFQGISDRVSAQPRLFSFLTLALLLSFCFSSRLFPWQLREKDVDERQYSAVKTLFNVSDTAKKTGSIYAFEREDGSIVVHNVGRNDPGLPALIGGLSLLGMDFSSYHDLGVLFLSIYWSSLLFLLLAMFVRSLSIPQLLVVAILNVLFLKSFGKTATVSLVSQHGLVPAMVNFILGFQLLLTTTFRGRHRRWFWPLLVLTGFSIGIFTQLRSSTGTCALISVLVYLLMQFILAPLLERGLDRKLVLPSLGKLALAVTCLLASYQMGSIHLQKAYLLQSNRTLGSKVTYDQIKTSSHGIWHNLYLGLGVLPNSAGIKWLDRVGDQHAKAVRPSVRYQSDEYFLILKNLYFSYLRRHPGEFLMNTALKAKLALTQALVVVRWPLLFLLFAAVTLFFRRSQGSPFPLARLDPVLYSAWLPFTLLLFLIPVVTTISFSSGFIVALFQLTVYLLTHLLASNNRVP